MKSINIISACNSSKLNIKNKKLVEGFNLAKHESQALSKLIDELKSIEIPSSSFNGYYISYSIKQISKEFDLLRFGKDAVINIELKAPLDEDIKIRKIERQMNHNYYYLKFLGVKLYMYTYVEDDGLYYFDIVRSKIKKVEIRELADTLCSQVLNHRVNLDEIFLPKNYLVSPFNDTNKFLAGEYFLTDHQYNIRKEVISNLLKQKYNVFCIAANAGTGKTLLAYDIAKHAIANNYHPLIIHCGKLNNGHMSLMSSGWIIRSIRNINIRLVKEWDKENIDLIIVDESQRISLYQLKLILDSSYEYKIPILFMYDTKQYLKTNETTNIYEYINKHYGQIPTLKRNLSNKIRTNKEMASFINNLVHIGSSKSYLNYDAITIEYFNDLEDVSRYINDLVKYDGWKAITFTTSLYTVEPLDEIASICESNAHDVIGQEFEKVVFVMDNNFKYNTDRRLAARKTFYNAKGMLYQIVTRVVQNLKIIVLDNDKLFRDLLNIKHCTFIDSESE